MGNNNTVIFFFSFSKNMFETKYSVLDIFGLIWSKHLQRKGHDVQRNFQ